ncbi:MAG: cysteine--tRNA ligase [Alkalispirochaeta sp.]
MNHTPRYDEIPVTVFNSLHRRLEAFHALEPPFVGMYVCGPTVYSDPHLGHARTGLAFDVVFRYLRFLGYRVRYVRNITDVGHLEDEQADTGEDKIAKRARLERVEPMEVVQRYTLSYHDGMRRMGCVPPSIEPRASGHVLEQIEVVEKILASGLAYEVDGSVYFDLQKYAGDPDADPARTGGAARAAGSSGSVDAGGTAAAGEASPYGQLSGRVFEDLMSNTRDTAGATEKRSTLDFALWKKAEPQHIMRWRSPWGEGFPGWHLECTTMSTRYLGEKFDIHGGGLDLQFPHHEAEIAQSHGAFGTDPAQYWLHSNMLTVDGQKMAKSLGNFITLEEMFSGAHQRLEQAFSPMVLRFFMLQSHYRSTVDFSNEALAAAEKGYHRLMTGLQHAEQVLSDEITQEAVSTARAALERSPVGPQDDEIAAMGRSIPAPGTLSGEDEHGSAVIAQIEACWRAMSDDFHTPKTIAALFELTRLTQRPEHATAPEELRRGAARAVRGFVRSVLGLHPEEESAAGSGTDDRLNQVMELVISLRGEARKNKDFGTADRIRDELAAAGIQLEDGREGTTWVSV